MYFELIEGAGTENILKAVPEYQPISRVAKSEIWTKVEKCVYIVIDRGFDVPYVGSVATRKSGDGVCARMAEHVRSAGREHWWAVYVIPIRNSVPDSKVREIEGFVARRLRRSDPGRNPRAT